jgi:hypothetical protein
MQMKQHWKCCLWYFLAKIMEANKSLQTQSNTINNDDEKMKWNLQNLHMQR